MEKENIYLSYLMGAENITDTDLTDLGINIAEKTESGDRKLKIPKEVIEKYKDLIKEKLTYGFWNEFLDENAIYFIFKFKNEDIKEYTLSLENEQEIDEICVEFNKETSDKNTNVYKYISENDFYHDFMIEYYKDMIER